MEIINWKQKDILQLNFDEVDVGIKGTSQALTFSKMIKERLILKY